VYFDVLKYNESNDYGVLSGRKIEDLIHNTRTLEGQTDKKKSSRFCFVEKSRTKTHYALALTMGFGISRLAH
jgi:cysteinyl-tRNA synthetase